MKSVLEFDLPDEQQEFAMAVAGREFFCALHDIAEHVRSRLKHTNPSKDVLAELDAIRALIPFALMDTIE